MIAPPADSPTGSPWGDASLAARVERYFTAVDRMDVQSTLACFAPDARVVIATFDTVYEGRDTAIRGMYERLFARYASVWHGNFDHVVQAPLRIASRFEVRNVGHDGHTTRKNNCNFFQLRGMLFDEVFIYMSGDNALR